MPLIASSGVASVVALRQCYTLLRFNAAMNCAWVSTKTHVAAVAIEKPSRTSMAIMMASEDMAKGRAMGDKKRSVFLRPLRPFVQYCQYLRLILIASAYRPPAENLRPPAFLRPL
jgi:hypothetical protein